MEGFITGIFFIDMLMVTCFAVCLGFCIPDTRVKTNSGTNSVMASRRDYNSAARWRKTGFEKTLYLQISMRASHIPTFFFIFGNIIQFAVCGIQE